MQSISKSAELTIGGDVENTSTGKLKLDVNAKINLERQKGGMLIKEWSDDVAVFVDVMRFKKKIFSKEKAFDSNPLIDNEKSFRINLESVDLSQYINE
ncbi:hypothetical protein [Aquimarina litoralis]|uniref:hypothetical protein n=1 Tax=Aquimarina litoralis TaxID=584605 RepID=UPI001C55AABD|nr:hypothetical protein [Aquimarina litoralis]MBW1295411.1 hypothetical protein [Aquimarina litoralis]